MEGAFGSDVTLRWHIAGAERRARLDMMALDAEVERPT
jgi:hypothetical protein